MPEDKLAVAARRLEKLLGQVGRLEDRGDLNDSEQKKVSRHTEFEQRLRLVRARLPEPHQDEPMSNPATSVLELAVSFNGACVDEALAREQARDGRKRAKAAARALASDARGVLEELRAEEKQRQRTFGTQKQAMVKDYAKKFANPARHFGQHVFTQMLQVEWAMRPEAQGCSGRSLGATFRSMLLGIFDESDLPAMPGLYSMDALQAALAEPVLHHAALGAIRDVKVLSSGLPGIIGRQIIDADHDSLRGIWQRATEMRRAERKAASRSAGRPPARTSFSLLQQKCGTRYTAAQRRALFRYRHMSGGSATALSMRGAQRLARQGSQLLFDITQDELDKVKLPSAGTCSTIDCTVHMIQRAKEVEYTFSQCAYWAACDEGSRDKKSFLAGAIGAVRPHDLRRAYEAFASKLARIGGKTAASIAAELVDRIKAMNAPLEQLHFFCTDNTNSMVGHKGGAHAKLCQMVDKETDHAHWIISRIPCLSHVGHNTALQVLRSLGPVQRAADDLLSHRKRRDDAVSGNRWLLPELLDDTCFLIKDTEGCVEHIRKVEKLQTIRDPPLSPNQRWLYSCSQASYLSPMGQRLEIAMGFIVDKMLQQHSKSLDEIQPEESFEGDDLNITFGMMADALEEASEVPHFRRVASLLRELGQPENRLGICVVAIFYESQFESFVNYTENDNARVFCSVHRVLRRTIEWVADAADPSNITSDVWTDDFEPLQAFAQTREAFKPVNVRKVASDAIQTLDVPSNP
jgi:hypothetical protein